MRKRFSFYKYAFVTGLSILCSSILTAQFSNYLFVYFTGNAKEDEQIRFAISNDGYNFRALNNNNPVISSALISETGGVRDPHILRSADGNFFYMVVTDMVSAKGWNSNRAMVLLKSKDLINWSSSVVNIQKRFPGNDSLLRVWAPQTIYDAVAKKYMIYFSMKHGKGADIIYYAYANAAFTDLETEPRQLFFSPTNGSCIDGDIAYKDGKYHLFFKTEGEGAGIKIAVSDKLTEGYVLQDKYVQQTKDPVEGAGVFKLNNSDEYILMYDVYTKGKYQFTKTKDLKTFTVIDEEVNMNFHPRHGTVISITAREAERLVSEWGNEEKDRTISLFKFQDIQLLNGIFKEAEQTDLKYILALDPDRLLAPYLREAGITPKANIYTNWENTGLDGHIGGHYLSALAMMYAATGNNKVKERLNYMLDELKKCQYRNGNGYIGGVPGSKDLWADVFSGKIVADGFSINKKWVPLYNIHKTFAGLKDAYLFTGNGKAKEMLIKFSDWFVQLSSSLSEQKMQDMLRAEHGGINEVLADVYAITGDKKYLDAAYSFSHKAILEPLINDQDKLNNLHANTQIPKIIGFKRMADLSNDAAYDKAAHFFWHTVVSNRTVAIGGNSVREHFNPTKDFSSMINSEQGPETCNTYNMLKLTSLLYKSDGLIKYVDYYERALYNHILTTQLPGKGGFVYFTPMRPGHYRVYSQPQTSMWCCVGSGMENHAKYSELIYAYENDDLYVNLFIPSRLNWKEKGLTITQQTNFPEQEKTTLTINKATAKPFAINIRYPSWIGPGALKIIINGKAIQINASPSSYITVKRLWKNGDKIEIYLPMKTTTEQLPDSSNYVALLHGPVVLAAKTDTTNMPGLFADDSRMGHVAKGTQYPLQDMPLFVSKDDNIVSRIIPVKGKTMTYRAKGLIYPAKYESLELIPFYKVNDSRYVIYWQKLTPDMLKEKQQKLADEETKKQKLTAMTIDVVTAGEQQPESDHFIESDRSNMGVNKDRHWRDAKGWFSYRMTDKDKATAALQVTYFGRDDNRRFKILINDQLLTEVILDGSHGDEFFSVDYPLPQEMLQKANGKFVVKFLANEGSVAGGIYEVRLLKK